MIDCIRHMNSGDLERVRAWRNHDSVKKFMFSQNEITFGAHHAWFNKADNDPLHKLFIYEEDKTPLGFTQLIGKDAHSFIYEWGFYISPDATKGTGTRMLQAMIKIAFERYNAYKVYGEVLGFNHASVKLHQRLGFKQEGVLKRHVFLNDTYHDVHCFGLFGNEII